MLEPYIKKRFCGFIHGLIVTILGGVKYVITIINPFKNVSPITLSPLKPIRPEERFRWSVNKIVLSVDPSAEPDDYVVVAIHGSRNYRSCVAFIKAGKKCCTFVEQNYLLCDITFYKGLVYGVSRVHLHIIVSLNLYYLDDPSARMKITHDIFR